MSEKKKLLLHTCCGPCSTAVTERLIDEYDITLFFYNPNITDEDEYKKRLATQQKFVDAFNENRISQLNTNNINALNKTHDEDQNSVKLIEGAYNRDAFFENVTGLENEKEGGRRCSACFLMRLRETAKTASSDGFDMFCTTLTVSPHKNAPEINRIGRESGEEFGIIYLDSDFKKKDGYRRSVQISKEYELYRQNYCGCEFSKWWKNEVR